MNARNTQVADLIDETQLDSADFAQAESVRTLQATIERQAEQLRMKDRELADQAKRLEAFSFRIVDLTAKIVEARNLESGRHVKRIRAYTRVLGQAIAARYPQYGLTPSDVEDIVLMSVLHDLGKIMVPDAILTKPASLTSEEMDQMRLHTVYGSNLVAIIEPDLDERYRVLAAQICRSHHERWDGKGYPDGLMGDETPIAAQITALADVCDALMHERVYKHAYAPDEAYKMIVGGECGAFSPALLDCLEATFGEITAIVKRELELEAAGDVTSD